MAKMKRNYFVAYKMGDEVGWSVLATEGPLVGNQQLLAVQGTLRKHMLENGVPEDKAMALTLTGVQRLEEEEPCLIQGN